MSETDLRVGVSLTTGWTSPRAPRPLDALAIAEVPDVEGWLGGLDFAGRLGLHGRTLTQLVEREPVRIIESDGDWARVAAQWQPTMDGDYPCWVPRAHLRASVDGDTDQPQPRIAADRAAILDSAFAFIGLTYLWGGTSPAGFDCSGLVHYCYRQAGVVVPRDADAQAAATTPVARGAEERGDLYFFGASIGAITHVGFVTAVEEMLHSPEDAHLPGAGAIEHTGLSDRLSNTVVHIGRFLQ